MAEKLVVTRHKALVLYLIKKGLIDATTKHMSHANVEDIKGKHVFGILPNWLACHAEKMTEIQLRLPLEKRGIELTLEEVEFYAVQPTTYKIIKLED